MELLLSAIACRRFAEDLEAVAGSDLVLLALDADGTIRRRGDGAVVERERARPEVAWGTYDLYGQGGAARPFYGFCARSQSLRWLASPAAGFENPFYADLLRRGVRLTTGHGTRVAIAEYVVRAVLDAFQHAELWRAAQAQRRWALDLPRFREVAGSMWLVYGVGHIGEEVATRARALGATVAGVRRRPRGDEPVDELLRPDEVVEQLGRFDVVALTAAANDTTRDLVDRQFLAAMAEDAVLVNIARGELVDEDALLAALDAGRPGRAVLDVTKVEPLPADSPLWTHPKVTVTPHGSGRSRSTNERLFPHFAENLRRYLDGRPLLDERTVADL